MFDNKENETPVSFTGGKITEVYGMANEEKMKALDAALAQIEKQYGKGSVTSLQIWELRLFQPAL